MRIFVLEEQRKHRTSDMGAVLIDVDQHCDASPLDQRAHSQSLDVIAAAHS